jgi:hypothetical protein
LVVDLVLGSLRFTPRKKGSHQEKNVRVTMQLEVPKDKYFKTYILHWYDPMDFDVGEAKEGLWVKNGLGS